jgi:predicted adenine nucleotide alpha hydrolase (AANH) superfamily ATPase
MRAGKKGGMVKHFLGEESLEAQMKYLEYGTRKKEMPPDMFVLAKVRIFYTFFCFCFFASSNRRFNSLA